MRETTTTNCAQDNVRQWTESRNSEPSFNSLAQTKRSKQRRWLRQRRDAASAWAALKMQPTRLFCLLVKTLGNTAQLCVCVCVRLVYKKKITKTKYTDRFCFIFAYCWRRVETEFLVLGVCVSMCLCLQVCVCVLAWMHVCACCCSCFCYSSSLLIFSCFAASLSERRWLYKAG